MTNATKIKWIAAILMPICIYLIPVNDIFTFEMRAFLVATVFVLSLAAFELLPNLLVGLLLPVMYVILGAVPVSGALGIWSGSFMIFMVIGGMIFANALDESGLLRRIVLWAGTKCKGSFLKLLMALMVAGLLVMAISFAGAWMITLVLCYGVVKALHLENTKEGILIMIVSQIVSTASLNFIYNPTAIALWGGGAQMADPTFEMKWWMQYVYDAPLIVIQFIIVFIFYKLYKYAFILIPMLFFLPGIDVATKQKSLDTVNLGFIVFIASCMGIGTVGAAVGIGPAISTYVAPMLSGCPKPVFLFLCIVFGIIMNILMTPSAMQGMFPGPLAALGQGIGIASPLIPFMAMFFANDMVFFPYENAYLLVMFGFGVMSMKEFMKYNVIKMGITLVLFWVLVLPWWYLLGLI